MKKLFLILTILALSTSSAFAALDAAIEWEVRTTGNANNGGGFKAGASGTDFSIQDTAERSWLPAGGTYTNDLSITDATPSVVTSASYNFVAADVGNIINLTAGTNVITGRYEIKSVATNAATLDRDAMSGAPSADGSGYEGGGVALTGTIASTIVAGNSIYILSGTYNETLDTAVAGGSGTDIKWIGYITNHSTIPYGTDRPLFDGQSTRTNAILIDVRANSIWHLRATGATGAGVLITILLTGPCENIKSNNNGSVGIQSVRTIMLNCEANNNTTYGFNSDVGLTLENCYSHDNTTIGFGYLAAAGGATNINCISESNSSHGFLFRTDGRTINCIAYNNTGASTDGIQTNLAANIGITVLCINTISKDNGRHGISRSSTSVGFIRVANSITHGNGGNGLNNISGIVATDNLTSDPLFTNPSANPPDFTLQSGSPAIGAGFPDSNWATRVGLANADYVINIGVDQDDNVAAGVGGGRRSGWSIQ